MDTLQQEKRSTLPWWVKEEIAHTKERETIFGTMAKVFVQNAIGIDADPRVVELAEKFAL